MNLIEYAVPFFILAMLFELAWGLWRGRNTYRLNDAVGSLFMGVLSQARRFVVLGVGGYIYHVVATELALWQMDASHWATWVFAFIAYDFCYYWLHRMGHERTILWAAHVAHHQSEDYNLSTALRQTSSGWLLSWIFYLPMFFAGVPAEVFITVGSLNLLYQFWVHTEHLPKLGWYEWFFVTPSNHRVHHAQNEIYLDRNYGGVFILWDRLFGTFQEEQEDEPCVFGIRGALRSFNPLWAISHIYVEMVQDSWRTARWSDKFRVWFGRMGWRPDDVAQEYPRDKTENLDDFQKFDPVMAPWVPGYAFFQLIAVVALLNYMTGGGYEGYGQGVALYSVLLGTTVLVAWWMENRSRGLLYGLEALRLLGAVWIAAVVGGSLATLLIAYVVVNALWLAVLKWREEPPGSPAPA